MFLHIVGNLLIPVVLHNLANLLTSNHSLAIEENQNWEEGRTKATVWHS